VTDFVTPGLRDGTQLLGLRLGVTASSLTVHIESGGTERGRALCGAKLAHLSDEPGEVTCARCAEKAAAYGLEPVLATSGATR
jgi:hypothetical protein